MLIFLLFNLIDMFTSHFQHDKSMGHLLSLHIVGVEMQAWRTPIAQAQDRIHLPPSLAMDNLGW